VPIALPAVADLAALAVFVLAIIVLYALIAFTGLLRGLFSWVPVVGGFIGDHILSHVQDGLNAAAGWTVGAMGHAAGLIWTPITWVANLFSRIGEAIWSGVTAAERIVQTTIPAAAGRVVAYAQQLYNQAIGHADALAGAVSAFATSLYHSALAAVGTAENAVSAFAQSLYHQAVALAQQALSAATTAIGATFTQVEHWVASQFTATTAWTEQRIAGVESEIGSVQGALQGEIGQVQGALEHEIAGAYSAATAYAQQAAAIAQAAGLAAAGTVALDLARWLEGCGKNLCSGLNGLSTLLQDLAPLVEGGILFALVAEAASDPAGVARDVEAVLTPIADTAVSLFRDATGIAA
jgi:hypothetical protein